MDYSTTKKYMEILRAQYDGCSDYRIAQLLQVTKGAASRWSLGKNGMGDEAAARLADLCGLDAIEVLTELHLERAQSRATRQYYEDILKLLDKSQVAVIALFSLALLPAFQAGSLI